MRSRALWAEHHWDGVEIPQHWQTPACLGVSGVCRRFLPCVKMRRGSAWPWGEGCCHWLVEAPKLLPSHFKETLYIPLSIFLWEDAPLPYFDWIKNRRCCPFRRLFLFLVSVSLALFLLANVVSYWERIEVLIAFALLTGNYLHISKALPVKSLFLTHLLGAAAF